jgi:hypothetical protein
MPEKYSEIFHRVAKEFVGMALTLVSIYLIRKLVEWLLGSEYFWDYVPVKYCIDTVDFFVILRFLWKVIKEFNK